MHHNRHVQAAMRSVPDVLEQYLAVHELVNAHHADSDLQEQHEAVGVGCKGVPRGPSKA